ncbi:hypothetical protein FBR02_19390 [Anaerolineae bacterium CFX9]|nr:hypothetical protein [Anaerolineae bacterium CFX9]
MPRPSKVPKRFTTLIWANADLFSLGRAGDVRCMDENFFREFGSMLVNVERLRARMSAEGLDALIGTTIENVHYFSGIWSTSLQMFPREGQCYAVVTIDRPAEPVMVTPTIEVDQVLDGFDTIRDTVIFGTFYREPPVNGVLTEEELRLSRMSDLSKAFPGAVEALVAALKQLGLADKKIGVDELGLKPGFLERLSQELPLATFVPATELLRWVRRVKTPEEIASAEIHPDPLRAQRHRRAGPAEPYTAPEGRPDLVRCRLHLQRVLVGSGAQLQPRRDEHPRADALPRHACRRAGSYRRDAPRHDRRGTVQPDAGSDTGSGRAALPPPSPGAWDRRGSL